MSETKKAYVVNIGHLLSSKYGLPGGTRTLDHLLRRQMLYPAELLGDIIL
jgi:hypothetical protein